MKRAIIVFCTFFLVTGLIGQDKIVHINKTYPDGTPREVIVYTYGDLESDNPFTIIKKIEYDRNGKIKKERRGISKLLLGKWSAEKYNERIWFKTQNELIWVGGEDWNRKSYVESYKVDFNVSPATIDMYKESGERDIKGIIRFIDDNKIEFSFSEGEHEKRPSNFKQGDVSIWNRIIE